MFLYVIIINMIKIKIILFSMFLSTNIVFAQSSGEHKNKSGKGSGAGNYSFFSTQKDFIDDIDLENMIDLENNKNNKDIENIENENQNQNQNENENENEIENKKQKKQLAKNPPLSCPIEKTPLYTKFFKDVPRNHWSFEKIEILRKNGIFGGYKSKNKQDNLYSGNFGPNNKINRVEILAMIINIKRCDMGYDIYNTTKNDPYLGEIPYSDVSKLAWYASYVSSSSKQNLLPMKSKKRFGVNDFVTRAEAVSVIIKGLNKKEEKSSFNFADTKNKHYSNILGFAHDKNYISGYKDGNFRPNKFVTRAEVAVIMYAVLKDLKKI